MAKTAHEMRATAGCWFDWVVYGGDLSPAYELELKGLLGGTGIQYLQEWPENRGQHHAFAAALKMARESGYTWLLRLDDDVLPKTKRWLKMMVTRLEEWKEVRTEDEHYRLIAAPRVMGLKNPLEPMGIADKGQKWPMEVMPGLGGVCRLHPVDLLGDFEPDLYAPRGRRDPEDLADYVEQKTMGGLLVRFPDIRVVHKTEDLEARDTPEQAEVRLMTRYWPWLGETV
jgi:hypothetical protein